MNQMSNTANTDQISIARTMLALESQIKGGMSWFFWIAGLSIINSIIYFTGGSITFVVGLGATQFIDGAVSALVREVNPTTGIIIRVIGYGLDFLLAGVFVACGILGRKKFRWAALFGMVFYLLDGLLSLAFADWLSTIFHALALFGLWKGQKAIKDLVLLEKSMATGTLSSIQTIITAAPSPSQPADPKKLTRFLLIVLVPFVLMILILIVMMLINSK